MKTSTALHFIIVRYGTKFMKEHLEVSSKSVDTECENMVFILVIMWTCLFTENCWSKKLIAELGFSANMKYKSCTILSADTRIMPFVSSKMKELHPEVE